MTKRKIALLAAIGVLATTFALQLALSGPTGAKTLAVKEAPDGVTVRKADASGALASGLPDVTLARDDSGWTVGTKGYAAEVSTVESMVDSVANLKVLGTVSRNLSAADEDRYGLADGSALEITLTKAGKTLRTLKVGKASPTAQQSYVTVDGKGEVYLVSGNLAEDFGKAEGDLRDKNVYALAADTLIGVAVSGSDSFSLAKTGNPATWSLPATPGAASATELDADKTASWVSSLASLRASKYLSDDAARPASALATVTMDFGSKKVSVSVLEKRPDGEYTCTSSENPSPFTLSSYVAEKYLKKLADIAK